MAGSSSGDVMQFHVKSTRYVAAGLFAVTMLVLNTACGTNAPDASKKSPGAGAESSATPGPNEFDGTYTVDYHDGDPRTWTVKSCGPGCADVTQAPFDGKPSTVRGRAQLTGTQWKLVVHRPDAIICPDESEHDGETIWIWNAKALEGQFNIHQFRDDCGDAMVPVPDEAFTLIKVNGDALPAGIRSS